MDEEVTLMLYCNPCEKKVECFISLSVQRAVYLECPGAPMTVKAEATHEIRCARCGNLLVRNSGLMVLL